MNNHLTRVAFMNGMINYLFLSITLVFSSFTEPSGSKLSGNKIIESNVLGYELQYRVYTPADYTNLVNLPVIFLTDGPGYIGSGDMPKLLDRLVAEGSIKPVIAVFVDARDPNNLNNNRRNEQFLGNDRYVQFYKEELVPLIDKEYKTSGRQVDRAIMGLSFGGLNAAYFGAKASDTFGMLGIQSPALHPVPQIHNLYKEQNKLPLKIFLSTGTVNDKEGDTRSLKKTLESKGYEFEYIEVPQGHNWKNWKPLIDDALIYFFGM